MTHALEVKKIGLGPNIAEFLRRIYLENRAKSIAADFNVSVGTAKRWLAGNTPTTAIIEEMANRWGVEFVTAAFADYLGAGDSDALALVELMKRERRGRYLGYAQMTADDFERLDAPNPYYLNDWRLTLKRLIQKILPRRKSFRTI